MALYLGSSGKVKISFVDGVYFPQLFSKIPITNGVRLLSSDNSILKDVNGLYVTAAKEDE